MRFRAPASIELRRAQLLLILAALVPTALATVAAILVLVFARRATDVVLGILVLVFGILAITGAAFVQVFLRRGDSLARMQNDFVSTVSHELRTPLTSIRMFVETLAMGRVKGDPQQQQAVLQMLAKEVLRLEVLVERILELAKLEAGKREFDRRATPVTAIVDGALTAFEATRLAGGGPEARLRLHVDPTLHVDVDQAALEQALLNLISNAYKYTGDDKQIDVQAVANGRKVEITVSDNGPGISWEDRRLIFNRFERGRDKERQTAPGAGMGLAVVNLIVRAHGGRVDVSSQPGAGASFRMLLPRSKTDVGEPSETRKEPGQAR
jgi:two-component system phosphate regulon sensor histidine kinase PhoR